MKRHVCYSISLSILLLNILLERAVFPANISTTNPEQLIFNLKSVYDFLLLECLSAIFY